MLTAAEVLKAKFAATKFREGYDQDEVDDFLDRVAVTLRARESGTVLPDALTVADVEARRFTTTKFREGYDGAAVDDFLAEVARTLGEPPPVVASPSVASPSVAGPVPGLIEQKSGWRRFFGG